MTGPTERDREMAEDAARDVVKWGCLLMTPDEFVALVAPMLAAARAEERERWRCALHNIAGISDDEPDGAAMCVTYKMGIAYGRGKADGIAEERKRWGGWRHASDKTK